MKNAKERLEQLIPDEQAATEFFERIAWPHGNVRCSSCKLGNVGKVAHKGRPGYQCRTCRRYFTVRTGTAMSRSNLPLAVWARAVYWMSMLAMDRGSMDKDLGVEWNTAARIAKRIRKACGVGVGHQATVRGPPRTLTAQLSLTTVEIRARMLA